jgi:hypothetical protein
MIKQIKSDEMPLATIYIKNAILTNENKALLLKWIEKKKEKKKKNA